MEWYNSESMSEPMEIDTESSAIYNYIRRNIHEVSEKIEGETVIKYEYEECKILKESWGIYQELVQQKADIDYLTMITEDI